MGKKYGNYHLQYLFDDLHVIYMFFTYYVNFQLFQCHCITKIQFIHNVHNVERFFSESKSLIVFRNVAFLL